MQQIQEDLPQEKADNEQEPEKKKEALKSSIADYNARYGTNHGVGEFDLYYQDVQTRIRFGVPSTMTRTRWMFGCQVRFVARMELLTLWPELGRLPQIEHFAINCASLLKAVGRTDRRSSRGCMIVSHCGRNRKRDVAAEPDHREDRP